MAPAFGTPSTSARFHPGSLAVVIWYAFGGPRDALQDMPELGSVAGLDGTAVPS